MTDETQEKKKLSTPKKIGLGVFWGLFAVAILYTGDEPASTQKAVTAQEAQEEIQQAIPPIVGQQLGEILSQWITACQHKNWEALPALTQQTYRANNSDADIMETVSNSYPINEDVIDTKVSNIKTITPWAYYAVTVELETANSFYHSTINVIKESAPYNASPQGTWGINPSSVIWWPKLKPKTQNK